MQTKSMSRLIFGENIAGFEKKEYDKFLGCVLIWWSIDGKIWDKAYDEIEHDAFEFGMEMDDGTWIFEGDEIEFIIADYLEVGVITWDKEHLTLTVVDNDTEMCNLAELLPPLADAHTYFNKRTGKTIHDKPDN